SVGDRPLTSRSAPLVVLVVATLTPDPSANGVRRAISVNSPPCSCAMAECRYIAGPPCSAEPLDQTLTVPPPARWPPTMRWAPPRLPASQPVASDTPPV